MDSSLMEREDEDPVVVEMMTDRPVGAWLRDARENEDDQNA